MEVSFEVQAYADKVVRSYRTGAEVLDYQIVNLHSLVLQPDLDRYDPSMKRLLCRNTVHMTPLPGFAYVVRSSAVTANTSSGLAHKRFRWTGEAVNDSGSVTAQLSLGPTGRISGTIKTTDGEHFRIKYLRDEDLHLIVRFGRFEGVSGSGACTAHQVEIQECYSFDNLPTFENEDIDSRFDPWVVRRVLSGRAYVVIASSRLREAAMSEFGERGEWRTPSREGLLYLYTNARSHRCEELVETRVELVERKPHCDIPVCNRSLHHGTISPGREVN